ncbi:MAG: hypothetical protein ABIY38_07885 [Rhodococcus sp. (in: high G+C Gram-positive bacteria)]
MRNEISIEKFETALDAIRKNPAEWNQVSWRCQSGMCFAGWVAASSGARWDRPEDPDDEYVIVPGRHDPDPIHVAQFAETELGADHITGLNRDEAEKIWGSGISPDADAWWFPESFSLFGGLNTLANLEGALQVLKDREAQRVHRT